MPITSLGAQPQKVTLTKADCAKCQTAFSSWQGGNDCTKDQKRCALSLETPYPLPLLQTCVLVNGRLIWTIGRECNDKDGYPCVKLRSGPTCWGCENQKDCTALQDQFDNKKLTCDTQAKRCFNCSGDNECSAYRSCEDRQCVGCTEDSHCAPEMTGRNCSDTFMCQCFDDDTCLGVGYISCNLESGTCKRCGSDKECQENFDTESKCVNSRCTSPCDADVDCEHYKNAICQENKCVVQRADCKQDTDCTKFGKDARCHQDRCTKPTSVPCSEDKACQRFGKGAKCVEKVCSIPGREGGPCTENADCVRLGRMGRCMNGLCRRLDASCASDDACVLISRGLRCYQGRCSSGKPEQCRVDGDCTKSSFGNKCIDGLCLPEGGCTTHQQCINAKKGQRCVWGKCLAKPECKTLSDCVRAKKPPICLLGRCVAKDSCASHSECIERFQSPTAKCDTKSGKCIPIDLECTLDSTCRKRLGYDKAKCEKGKCRSGLTCKTPHECAALSANAKCLDGECVPSPVGCVDDQDCAADHICFRNKCIIRFRYCRKNIPCPQGKKVKQTCHEGRCVSGQCKSNKECDTKDSPAGICVKGWCYPNDDCKKADECRARQTITVKCLNKKCVRDLKGCQTTQDCLEIQGKNSQCLKGKCVVVCSKRSDCPNELSIFCYTNRCVNVPCIGDFLCKRLHPQAKCKKGKCALAQ